MKKYVNQWTLGNNLLFLTIKRDKIYFSVRIILLSDNQLRSVLENEPLDADYYLFEFDYNIHKTLSTIVAYISCDQNYCHIIIATILRCIRMTV